MVMADNKDKKGDKKKKEVKKAGGKLSVTDECFVPSRTQKIYYKGPNPSSIATKLTSSFQPFFRISSAGWGEPDFRWDTSGEPATFFIKWWLKKSFSGSSTMWLYVYVQGDENTQTKQGKFTLELYPTLVTTVPENWAVRGLYMIYNYLFYDKMRQDFIKECSDTVTAYKEHIKTEFNLTTGEHKKSVDIHRF